MTASCYSELEVVGVIIIIIIIVIIVAVIDSVATYFR